MTRNLLGLQVQGMIDLLLVFMRPLARHDDGDAARFVDISQARFRLQVGMLLPGRLVMPFDDDISRCPGRPPYRRGGCDNRVTRFARMLRVQLRRRGLHGRFGIEYRRQIFILHRDQLKRLLGDGVRLRHHRRHHVHIAAEPHPFPLCRRQAHRAPADPS